MRGLLGMWLALALSTTVEAQVPAPVIPTGIDVMIIAPSADPVTAAPVAVRSTPISATLNCNLAATPAPVGTLLNPTQLEFDDPFTPGRVCRVPIPNGLPNAAGYQAAALLTATCNGSPCMSIRSLPDGLPFNLAGPQLPPVAPRTLGLRP